MKTQILPYLAPQGGLRLDQPPDLIQDMEMSDCRNVFMQDGKIRSRYGYKKHGDKTLPLTGVPTGFDQFYTFDGNDWLFAMTTTDIYKWDTTLEEWILYTPHEDLDRCETGWTYYPTSNLVGWWKLNDNEDDSNVVDSSQNTNTGTVVNDETNYSSEQYNSSGKIDGCFDFDGTNDYVSVSNDSSLNFGTTTDFSILAWFKTSDDGNAIYLIHKGNLYTNTAYSIRKTMANKLVFTIADNSGYVEITSNDTINDGKWHHIAVTANRDGNATMYIDGSIQTNTKSISGIGDIDHTNDLFIGTNKSAGQFWNGSIDDVRIYNKVLSLAEILAIYNSGDGLDELSANADCVEGSYSIKITLAAERSENDLLAYKDISSTDITSHNSIGFWIKASTNLAAGDLKVVVSESNHASGERTGTYTEVDITALTANTWTYVRAAKTLTNYNEVISVSLFAGATVAAGTLIYLDDIRAYTPYTGVYTTDGSGTVNFWSSDYVRKTTETDPWWIATNGKDKIQVYKGGSKVVMEDLITDFPTAAPTLLANNLVEFKTYLVLVATTEDGNYCPQRIRWSDTANPEDFLNGNASYQDLSGADWIQTAVKFKGDYLVVFKERSIWMGYATGESDIFNFDQKVSGTGTSAGKTVEVLADEIIFLGWDDVYVFDGIDY